MADPQQNKPAVARDERGRLVKGTAPPNPGGRPKGIREIEAMLNAEHRTAENMRHVFRELKALALRGDKGDAQYMKLYLERVLGPVKDVEDLDRLLADAPPEVVAYIREHFN
jgi:hypothetical protein